MSRPIKYINCLLIAVILTTTSCRQSAKILKVEMDLSSFGVESDNYPNIHVYIDFVKDTSWCEKSYYSPGNAQSTYSLNEQEMKEIHNLIKGANLDELKKGFKVNESDQPSSTIKVYTDKETAVIKDYGLKGDEPLQKLYQIAYKY